MSSQEEQKHKKKPIAGGPAIGMSNLYELSYQQSFISESVSVSFSGSVTRSFVMCT